MKKEISRTEQKIGLLTFTSIVEMDEEYQERNKIQKAIFHNFCEGESFDAECPRAGGKTTVLMDIASYALSNKKEVLFISETYKQSDILKRDSRGDIKEKITFRCISEINSFGRKFDLILIDECSRKPLEALGLHLKINGQVINLFTSPNITYKYTANDDLDYFKKFELEKKSKFIGEDNLKRDYF